MRGRLETVQSADQPPEFAAGNDERRRGLTITAMTDAPSLQRRPLDRLAAMMGILLIALLMWWLSGWTGEERSAAVVAVWVLLTAAPWALLWLAAAFGFGWPLRAWLIPKAGGGPALQGALGVAALLFLDGCLGRLGFLQIGGSAGAWGVLAVGVLLLAVQLWRAARVSRTTPPLTPHWPVWAAAPAVAILLVAACSAPGWLWSSEFGGYDALSYHLQLPKEWLSLGHMQGFEHNVYSFLPSSVEAAYYHLGVLTGDGIEAACACQLLHALLALLTVVLVAQLARRLGGPLAGSLAAIIVLGTPWVIVVGSLAYNEMAVALLLAGGLSLALDDSAGQAPVRRGIAIGLLAGAACSAKLTAIGFAALPLGLLLLLHTRPARRILPVSLGAAAAAIAILLPWLISNGIETGNPLFPFVTTILAAGHWTAEQASTFASAHVMDLPLGPRLAEGWHQLMCYGIGPNPDPAEPWQPQWSILPWLALAGLVTGCLSSRSRSMTLRLALVLAIQIVFWLAFTHVKSRFMLPAVVPAALLVSLVAAHLIEPIRAGAPRHGAIAIIAILSIAYGCLPLIVFRNEAGGRGAAAIGAIDFYTGDAQLELFPPEELRRADPEETSPALWINHLLQADARILCLGEATPFYYRDERIVYQTTWDRGPMSRIMRQAGDDPAAWIDALAREGFTHLLVNSTMLRIWERERWNDPLITDERISFAAERFATVERRFPNGITLYRLPAPADG